MKEILRRKDKKVMRMELIAHRIKRHALYNVVERMLSSHTTGGY